MSRGQNEKMQNIFPWAIVALFICATISSLINKNFIKAGFYLCSALINIFTIYM